MKATKQTRLIDCRVVAEFKHGQFIRWGLGGQDRVEAMAKASESRCKEFNEFIRDHRSQDDIYLTVERITEEQCSECNQAWEIDYSESTPTCAHCGIEINL